MSENIINDVNIRVATINGTGSQSANLVLIRSIFNMGIPVSGKNLFPSNIKGLPTWYTIRATPKGYKANKHHLDILVALNPNTVVDDIADLRPGAVFIYNTSDMKIDSHLREDHTIYPVPFSELVDQCTDNIKLKRLVINMIYVGVLAELLDMEQDALHKALQQQFPSKPKAVEINMKAIEVGREYARKNLEKKDPFALKPMNATQDQMLIEGNTACALGALMGGCTVLAWYPITPSSSVCETLIDYFKQYRIDDQGKAKFAVLQAEDEIAAIGAVLGAGWAGARSMTASSGPGISLMSELIGYGYFAEIPAVIFDIQRMGPSTGLPTRSCQGDIMSVSQLSHGDTQHAILLPTSMEECYEMSKDAFDYAERFQTPVFVLSDLDLGMNTWMSSPFSYPQNELERGKVLNAETLEQMGKFERYADVDGDGIPYRTLPGTPSFKAAYFTRGSGHNEKAHYSEKPEDWKRIMDRLKKKFETIRDQLPQPLLTNAQEKTDVGILAFGSTHWAVEEMLDLLHKQDIHLDYMRIRSLPLSLQVRDFIKNHQRIYVIEQNRDAQMTSLVRLQTPIYAARVQSILHYNGSFIDAESIMKQLLTLETGAKETREEIYA